jgi:glycosyltransferase involved in cell wall biosynthesis
MTGYGVMLYLAGMLDAFSSATAEALAAGVIVIASGQGSNAEFIRHGWNGFLVPADAEARPDLGEAERVLRRYLERPERFRAMRRRAMESVPTWDEQAAQWRRVWRSN